MNCYVTTFDRVTWECLCNRLFTEKYRFGFIMQPRGYGKTMTSRALFRSIINVFHDDFDKNTISLRWCEYFEIPNFRGRKNYIVYMAKIERYILPKTRFRR